MAPEKTDVVIVGVGAAGEIPVACAPGLEFLHLSMIHLRKESRRDI